MSFDTKMVNDELRTILSPSLLLDLHETAVPPRGVSGAQLFDRFFGHSERAVIPSLHSLCFCQALLPLSRIPLAAYPPDFFQLLPAASELHFPEYALGLHILLDQAPRLLLGSQTTNARWTNAFFDVLALRLAQNLDTLPDDLEVRSGKRWQKLGYSWIDGAVRRDLLSSAYVHDEGDFYHRSIQMTEDLRLEAEQEYGQEDPARTDAEAQKAETHADALFRLVSSDTIPPRWYANQGHFEYVCFMSQIMRAHTPPLMTFGRYPWRNGAMGREPTAEETLFMERWQQFQPPPDVRRKIREDILAGVWTPIRS